ncbi:MAG: ABC transporter permease [Deltaproteobacteria bacterium]|nr:ABC transporter permease [Deltaproteobacteria bacterium]
MTGLKRLLQISWRNVFRNKRRSFLTLMILVLGCTGLILVGGFFQNLIEGYREQFIHSQTGHLQVNRVGYFKMGASAPLDYLMTDAETVRRQVEAFPGVNYTVPRLKFGGMASTENSSVAVLAVGTDAVAERKMGSVKASNVAYSSTRIVAGQDLDPSDVEGVLLGKGLAEALNVDVGDRFTFLTTRKAGAIDGTEMRVRGVFETIAKDFDDRALKMNLATAQRLLDAPNQIHSFLVLLNDTALTEANQELLRHRFLQDKKSLEVLSWEEQGLFYRQSKDMLLRIYSVIQIIICVIFVFSIANTINMAIFERMREFGTMMAIGNGRPTIFMTIFLEAAILGALGSLLGIATGVGLAHVISAIGIEMPPPPQSSTSYFAMITVSRELILQTFALSMLATVLSSILPAHRASRFRIVQALGYV